MHLAVELDLVKDFPAVGLESAIVVVQVNASGAADHPIEKA